MHLDDNHADGQLVASELERRTFPCAITFVQTEKAFRAALTNDPYDVILCDFKMPRFDGDQAFLVAKEFCPDVPFILVTGELGEEFVIERLKQGVTDYVLKDNLRRLVPAIERALEERDIHRTHLEMDERYRRLVQVSPDAIIVHADGRFMFVNPAGVKLFGARQESDLIGKPVLPFVPSDPHQTASDHINAMTREPGPTSLIQQKLIRLDGTVIDVEVAGTTFEYQGRTAIQVVMRDCTERMRSEEFIRKSRERFKVIFDQSPLGIGISDEHGHWIEFNDSALRMFGIRHLDDLRGISLFDNPEISDHDRALLRGGGILRKESVYDFDMIRQTGFFPTTCSGRKYFDGIITPLFDAAGAQPSGFLLQIQDITKRKQAEAAMQESRQRLRQIIDLVPHFIFAKDADGRFILVNKAVADVYGTTVEDLTGKTDADFAKSADEVRHFREDDMAVINSGKPKFIPEETITDASGRNRILTTVKIPYTTSGSSMPAILGVSVDITHRKQTEEALRESEQQYQALFHNSPLPKWIMRLSDLSFLEVNEAAVRQYGYSRPEFLAMTLADIRTEPLSGWANRISRGEDGHLVTRHRTKDGRVLDVDTHFRIIDYYGTEALISEIHDITEQRTIEIALQESERRLEQINQELEERVKERTEELTDANRELEGFSYSVSHDLKAPLRAIVGFSKILLEDISTQLSDRDRAYLEAITENAGHLGTLVDELLAFFRLNKAGVRKQPVDMKLIVESVVRAHREAEPERAINVVIGDLPEVEADPTLIRQAVENVVANAFKYTQRRPETNIEIGARYDHQEVVYYVSDNGVGFDMNEYGKLFGVFQRLDNAAEYEGTGVGLAFTRQIVKRHGGRTWAEGKPGEGATFYFSLPKGETDMG